MDRIGCGFVVSLCVAGVMFMLAAGSSHAGGVLIDHNDTDIASMPLSAINNAKSKLHIGYGHTSHGSQVTTGMTGLVGSMLTGLI